MLNVAEAAFAERGYDSVSMQDIAARCGISKPMVYAYFGSKEGIYLACIERASRDLYDALGQAASGSAAPEERLWLGALAFFDWVAQNEGSYRVLCGPGSSHGDAVADAVARLRSDQARLIERLLGESVAAEDRALEPIAHALLGAAESLAAWWIDSGEPREAVARRFMGLCWQGLGDMARDGPWQPPVSGAVPYPVARR
jgi:AcrR family transcriptional regulator